MFNGSSVKSYRHCGYLLANVDCQECKGPIIECLLLRYCQHTTLPVEGCSTRSGTYYPPVSPSLIGTIRQLSLRKMPAKRMSMTPSNPDGFHTS